MVSYLDQAGLKHTLEKLRNQMYPVGSLYFSTDSTSPATIYGGSWERYGKGRTLVSVVIGPEEGSFINIKDVSKGVHHAHASI